ncbi:GAF domain-containing protein [Nocardioides panacisoli]|uniref:GAF domain-containing protein n=1 Tax=Nocardioides panacisoli TaxID=627624 RepID=UPI001C6346EF|nr:GAF domain-containing protein [Nocardioides panacisoli]QYJ03638.1 GAF domain-containing protein [Nocardioides panacisoli]
MRLLLRPVVARAVALQGDVTAGAAPLGGFTLGSTGRAEQVSTDHSPGHRGGSMFYRAAVEGDVEAEARSGRERELASLYATARSLTALGDVDDVLRSIVRHAHDLIGTDFTYLSLLGDDGVLGITASEGTISADFRSAHIPPGTGLGGTVVESRAAHWVADYAAAGELRHDPGFDSLVGNEGLVALLGVPLLARDRVIGVLFAAERTERHFRTDEIALLSAFADHAAVALDNARLYEQSREALGELQSAYRTIEDQMAIMQRAQSVHDALTAVVLAGGGPATVASELADRLGGAVTLLDRDGALLARGGEEVAAGEASDGALRAIEEARAGGRTVTTVGADGHQHSAATVRAGESVLGTLVWRHRQDPGPVDLRSLELATHVVGLLILKENATAEAAERLSGELLTELIVASPHPTATQEARASTRGIDLRALDAVFTVRADGVATSDVVRRLHAIAREQRGLAGEHRGRATLMAAADDVEATAREVHRRLRAETGAPVVVVGERVRDHDWARAFLLATRCLAVAGHLGATDLGATTSRFSLYALVFDADRAEELDRFLGDAIGPLLEYDARRGTDLVATLAAYFDHDGNLRRTARALHVHLNTLLKRVDRIATVLGRDWRSSDDLQLRLAVRLQALRERLDH